MTLDRRQTIYLRPDATSYDGLCEQCLHDLQQPASLSHRVAEVHGSLRAEADVGFTCCRRGHRIRVRRVGRPAEPVPRPTPLRYSYR
jgi:hypothetical protein